MFFLTNQATPELVNCLLVCRQRSRNRGKSWPWLNFRFRCRECSPTVNQGDISGKKAQNSLVIGDGKK
jgi:hypothetical protein